VRVEPPPLASREWLATMRAGLTRQSARRKEAGGAMFIAIRRRLPLWYTATFALLLLLSGLLLYLGMNQAVLGPVDGALHDSATHISSEWLTSPAVGPGATCSQMLAHAARELVGIPYAACYDASGTVQALTLQALPLPTSTIQLQPFTAPALVQSALASANGTPPDTVYLGPGLVPPRLFAMVAR